MRAKEAYPYTVLFQLQEMKRVGKIAYPPKLTPTAYTALLKENYRTKETSGFLNYFIG